MLDIVKVAKGSRIKYRGDSWAFGGTYSVVYGESTYQNRDDCPPVYQGVLVIIEMTNDDRMMLFPVAKLDPTEWELIL